MNLFKEHRDNPSEMLEVKNLIQIVVRKSEHFSSEKKKSISSWIIVQQGTVVC